MKHFIRVLAPVLGLGLFCLLAPRAQAQDATKDQGAFVVAYPVPKKASHRVLMRALRKSGALDNLAKSLNADFILPCNITIAFEELGQANAFYSPKTHRISIGYELMDDFDGLFLQAGAKTAEGRDKAHMEMFSATFFIFMHELWHALIDVYDLPVVGREEDAVDQFSVFVLAGSKDPDEADGATIALNGAIAFLLLAKRDEQTLPDLPLWDEHSLSTQRFYNILSLIYGSDPEKFHAIADEGIVPANRTAKSVAEWTQVSKSWSRLLKPHEKQ